MSSHDSKMGTDAGRLDEAERERLVYELIAAAADRDLGTVYGAVPAAALEAITAGLRPLCEFAPPPSYQAFMATFGSLRVLDASGEVAGLWVYTPREAIERTVAAVRSRGEDDDPEATTTEHLVAFADDGGGGHWCFDTRAPGPELPVCLHHRDAPVHARRVESGESVSGQAPDYADFTAWLRGEIAAFCRTD